jgi:hypothetical protein
VSEHSSFFESKSCFSIEFVSSCISARLCLVLPVFSILAPSELGFFLYSCLFGAYGFVLAFYSLYWAELELLFNRFAVVWQYAFKSVPILACFFNMHNMLRCKERDGSDTWSWKMAILWSQLRISCFLAPLASCEYLF